MSVSKLCVFTLFNSGGFGLLCCPSVTLFTETVMSVVRVLFLVVRLVDPLAVFESLVKYGSPSFVGVVTLLNGNYLIWRIEPLFWGVRNFILFTNFSTLFFWNQGCSRISWAVGRRSGSFCSNSFTKSLAWFEMGHHYWFSKFNFCDVILDTYLSLVLAKKGMVVVSNSWSMTPSDQQSAFIP